jgi:hypothetical protein
LIEVYFISHADFFVTNNRVRFSPKEFVEKALKGKGVETKGGY